MTRRLARLVVAVSAALSLLVLSSALFVTPSRANAPTGCVYRWTGPGFGWLKDADYCDGQCSAPAGNGQYLNQVVVTPCLKVSCR